MQISVQRMDVDNLWSQKLDVTIITVHFINII
jgi:hypothetical protein